jgi:hypothetical protein
MIDDGGLAHSLYVQLIISCRKRITAQIYRILAGGNVRQLHEVLAVRADVGDVVVNRGFGACQRPLQ